MRPTLKRWEVAPRAPDNHFDRFSHLRPLVVQVLYNRGITSPADVEEFINGTWSQDNPFDLSGMNRAVSRLRQAIKDDQPIAVYGDYDADGVTATALMVQVLTALGAKVCTYIPNRFDEGYGLNKEALAELAGQGVKVVLTVDCGIRSIEEVAYGAGLGLDIIITDHHHLAQDEAGDDLLPPALAALNPKQRRCAYPFKELAGVGLAYKLSQALLRTTTWLDRRSPPLREEDLLDLVALGTVADLAPLVGENRMLVQQGLARLNQTERPGLRALIEQTLTRPGKIRSGTIGFTLGPRLNAAGRLDSALTAYRLLVTTQPDEARQLAATLDAQNRERQNLTLASQGKARQVILADEARAPLYFISDPDFNPGIVGLVASRLTDEFYRPTLVAERGQTHTRGSARSIPEFHITHALDQCADLLVRYGGHAAAAGFTLKNENVPEFEDRLLNIAGDALSGHELLPTLTIDAEVNLRGVSWELVQALADLEPFGYSNPTPCFSTCGLAVKSQRRVGAEGKHLKLVVHDGKRAWSAIAFGQGEWAEHLPRRVDLAYALEINEWNGQQRLQLNVKDIRPATEEG
ncbi:MAG: single-stranded-DNA-specific exonuclease RecJ [Anaerolineae bacterium]